MHRHVSLIYMLSLFMNVAVLQCAFLFYFVVSQLLTVPDISLCRVSKQAVQLNGVFFTYIRSGRSVICYQESCLSSFFYIVKIIQDSDKPEKKN